MKTPAPAFKSFARRFASAMVFTFLSIASLPHAHAATVTWDNSAGTGVWGTATNWDTNTVPVGGDTVIINNGDTVYTNVNLPTLNVTISGNSVWTSNVNATTGGVIRIGGSTVTVESGSSLSGSNFWDLANGYLTFYNGAIANMTNWEYKGTNTVKFILGGSGFTALTPVTQMFGGGATAANQSYVVDFASYTGGSTTLTLIDFTNASLNATSFLTGSFSYLNNTGYNATMSFNDSTKAIQLAITKLPSTWSGGTGNWSAGFSPAIATGDAVKFTGAGGTATNNIASGTLSSLDSILFDSGAGAYTLAANSGSAGNGSALTITGGITNNSSSTQTINMDLGFSTIQTVAATSGNISIGGVVSGAGGLTKSGTSTLILNGNNTYSGATTISAGTLEIGASGRLGAGSYAGSISNSGTFIYSGTNAQTISGSFSGSGSIIKNGSGTLTITGATSSGAITINSGSLVLQAPSNYAGLNASGININNGSTVTIQGNYGMWASKTFTFDSNGGGAMIVGPGNVVFRPAQTFTTNGGSQNTISGSLNCDGAVTHTFNIADGTDDTDLLVSATLQGIVSIQKTGAGKMSLSATNGYSGSTTITGGTLEISGAGKLGSGSYAGAISNSGTFSYNSTSSQTLSGVISGAGALTKSAASTLTLSGANTYTGATTISAGTLEIGAAGRLGAGSYAGNISNSGTFIYSGTNAQTLSGVISGTGNLTQNASSTLTLSGANTYTGATTISAGTIQIGAGGTTGSLSTSSSITNNGALVFNRSNAISQGTDFANGISGTGSLTQNGSGTLTLSSANTYSGGTTLNAGTLVIGNTAAAGTGTITQTDGTSLLKFDTTGTVTNDLSIYNVATTQTITLSGDITAHNTTYDVASGTTLSLNGTISGSGGITKNGTGTLEVNGASNTYTGDTVVNAGTLEANASGALGASGNITVHNGGSLLVQASNAIGNSSNVNLNGGTWGFNGDISDTVGALTLSANSTIDMKDGNISLFFSSLGSALTSSTRLNVYNYTLDSDHIYFTSNANLSSSLPYISFYSGFGTGFIGSSFVEGLSSPWQVRPVPEPETWATAALLLIGGGIWMWRKRRAGSACSVGL